VPISTNLRLQEPIYYETPYSPFAIGEVDTNLITSVLLLAYDQYRTLCTLVHRHDDNGAKLISSPGKFMKSGCQWGTSANITVTRRTGLDIGHYYFHVLPDTSESGKKSVNFCVFIPFNLSHSVVKQTELNKLDETFSNNRSRNRWMSISKLLRLQDGVLNCHFRLNLCLVANKFDMKKLNNK